MLFCFIAFMLISSLSHLLFPAPSSVVSLSEVMKVVESLGEEVGGNQVRQVAH